jgi:hypothetical protein
MQSSYDAPLFPYAGFKQHDAVGKTNMEAKDFFLPPLINPSCQPLSTKDTPKIVNAPEDLRGRRNSDFNLRNHSLL